MSGIALGAAYAAVQLVHQAYSKVKTSKARCARLVGRCQFVVDRLERIAATKGGDVIIRERIYELEWAFEQTARTIVQVGQQGVIASLLRAEANALRIEACNEALTELISLFNLEEIVDVRRWQTDSEVARVRDHHELLSMGHRIESDNAAINRELAQQGDTIAQVLQGIHDINAGLQNAPLNRRETLEIAVAPSTTRTRTSAPLPKAKVTGSGTLVSEPSTPYIPCAFSSRTAAAKTRSSTLRRLTFTRNCVKMVPPALTKVFSSKSKLSSSVFPSSSHSPSAHPARGSSSPSASPKANVVERDATGGECPQQERDSGISVSSCDHHPLPAEPPPPYQLRVANPAPARASEYEYEYDYYHNIHGRGAALASATMSSSSRFTAASVEAIRAPDSPVPPFPSPKLSTESVFGGSTTRSLASSLSDWEPASALAPPAKNTNRTDTTATTISESRHMASLQNSTARGTGPALRRKDTIGFARRRVTLSSSGYQSVKPAVSSSQFKPLVRGRKSIS